PPATASSCSPPRPVRCSTTTRSGACCSAWPPWARSTRSANASSTPPGTSLDVPQLPAANRAHQGTKASTSRDHTGVMAERGAIGTTPPMPAPPPPTRYHRWLGWYAPAMRRAVVVSAIGLIVVVVLLRFLPWGLAVVVGWAAAALT